VNVPKTVLVIDDSPSMRAMVAETLRGAGFAVVEGENGEDGLRRLQAQKPDLILTDVNMPVMDGITFVAHLRQRPDHRFTPVLILTTEASEGRKQAGKTAGATGWLVKPFDPDQLLKTIARVLP
jgi:two-component system chemotaxis response regulator CheY